MKFEAQSKKLSTSHIKSIYGIYFCFCESNNLPYFLILQFNPKTSKNYRIDPRTNHL